MIDVKQLEQVIAEVIGHTRRELELRIDKLEAQLLLERRLSSLEARAGGPDASVEFDLPNWRKASDQ